MAHPDRELAKDIKRFRRAGVPTTTIARMINIDHDTLKRHYSKELNDTHAHSIAELSDCAYEQALNGSEKLLMFLLKTQGSRYGFNEKQVIETIKSSESVDELKLKIAELEDKHKQEY